MMLRIMISRKKKRYVMAALLVAILCVFAGIYYSRYIAAHPKIDQDIDYPVASVVDGDTFRVWIGRRLITVRMLGIDTPETVHPNKDIQCYGPEASSAAKELLPGRSVRLGLSAGREEKDRYGRYLAYAYTDGAASVNEIMLSRGLAREYTYGPPYSLQSLFKRVEREAQLEKKGLWGACDE